MTILENLKNKSDNIEIDELIKRLILELGLKDDDKSKTLLYSALYHTLLIILDTVHLRKMIEPLYPTWVDMTKDYWALNGYTNILNKQNEQEEISNGKKRKIKSITVGDTTTTFVDETNNIEINGVVYKTGTINFDKNILVEKYSEALYRNRRFNYGGR